MRVLSFLNADAGEIAWSGYPAGRLRCHGVHGQVSRAQRELARLLCEREWLPWLLFPRKRILG